MSVKGLMVYLLTISPTAFSLDEVNKINVMSDLEFLLSVAVFVPFYIMYILLPICVLIFFQKIL